MPGSGLAGSQSPALDFLRNGFAAPMELLFLPAAAIFLAGVVLNLRRWRGVPGGRAGGKARAWPVLSRLVDLAFLQRKMLGRPFSAWMHLPVFWGILLLALGSFLILVDSYILRTLGVLLPRGLLYVMFQTSLEVAGIALAFGVTLALYRRCFRPREGVEADRRAPVLLLVLLGMALSGFVLEGLRIRIESGDRWESWSFAGSAVAWLLAV